VCSSPTRLATPPLAPPARLLAAAPLAGERAAARLVGELAAGGAGAGGAAGGAGTGGGGTGGGPVRNGVAPPNVPGAGAVEATSLAALSGQTQNAINGCDAASPECVADALDAYAAALQQIAPQLPPQLRSLPTVVATAASQVRFSRNPRQAIQALRVAIAAVHKSIALLRADDPVTLKAATREGALVAATLQVADDKLERAIGL
jgi:hypothetical protein